MIYYMLLQTIVLIQMILIFIKKMKEMDMFNMSISQ